jgi:hypothetical protein
MNTSIDAVGGYMERHRAWSLAVKQFVEREIRNRDSTRDQASEPEDSPVESHGG